MDYLLECLQAWEHAKQHGHPFMNKDDVPKAQVRIDAVGGSSAGGMTAMLLALAYLSPKFRTATATATKARRSTESQPERSLFYKTWVQFQTDQGTLDLPARLFDLDDLDTTNQRLPSAVNGTFLDALADHLFPQEANGDLDAMVAQLPPYLSKNLEILLTHTLLEGIPLEVDFKAMTTIPSEPAHKSPEEAAASASMERENKNKEKPHHTTYEHHLQTHFRLNKGNRPYPEDYLALDPTSTEAAKIMRQAALATGAFPIGLPPRPLDLPSPYIKAAVKRNIFRTYGDQTPVNGVFFPGFEQPHRSMLTVDGGAVNNEPFQEVIDTLRFSPSENNLNANIKKSGPDNNEKTALCQDFGIMLIDPFPDHSPMPTTQAAHQHKTHDPEASRHASDTGTPAVMRLSSIAGRMVRVLWNSAKTKRRELRQEDRDRYIRGQIWPVKYRPFSETKGQLIKHPFPIASGSMEAFGGLFSKAFRDHDYQLGRANMRNYIGHWFRMPYAEADRHPMYKEWSPNALKVFSFYDTHEKTKFLPIIPDFTVLTKDGSKRYAFNDYGTPPKHLLSVGALKAMRKPLYRRVRRLLKDELQNRAKNAGAEKRKNSGSEEFAKRQAIADLMQNVYANRGAVDQLGGMLGRFVGRLAFLFAPGVLSKNLSTALMREIIRDLDRRELLDKSQLDAFQKKKNRKEQPSTTDTGPG